MDSRLIWHNKNLESQVQKDDLNWRQSKLWIYFHSTLFFASVVAHIHVLIIARSIAKHDQLWNHRQIHKHVYDIDTNWLN
nr:hypothetical protein [Candidatus Cloacimonadota bacterium]